MDALGLHILASLCAWPRKAGGILPLPLKERQTLHHRLNEIFANQHRPLKQKAILLETLENLTQHIPKDHSLAAPATAAAHIRDLLNRLHERPTDALSVGHALAITGLGKTGFHQAFRQATGTSFTRYQIRLKIGEAARLLGSTDRDILDIAFSCGFNSISRFYAAFSQQMGMSPRRYRVTRGDEGANSSSQ